MLTRDELASRIAIQELQADYWWFLDSKQFGKLLEQVFLPGLIYHEAIGDAQPSVPTRTAQDWVDRVDAALAGTTTAHQGHQSKIVFHDETNATGRFVLNDVLVNPEQGWAMRGLGYYVNDYVLTPDGWRISVMRLGYQALERGTADGFVIGAFHYPEGEMTGQ